MEHLGVYIIVYRLICVHTYIHTYIQTDRQTYTYRHTYIRTYVRTYIHTHAHVNTNNPRPTTTQLHSTEPTSPERQDAVSDATEKKLKKKAENLGFAWVLVGFDEDIPFGKLTSLLKITIFNGNINYQWDIFNSYVKLLNVMTMETYCGYAHNISWNSYVMDIYSLWDLNSNNGRILQRIYPQHPSA